MSWRAESRKKPIFMISTGCSAKPVSVQTRRDVVSKQAAVDVYNHSMNGVDVADQLTVFYSFVRKTRKWWRKLFFWLLEVSVVNSYLLYKQTVPGPSNHLAYRRAIVEKVAMICVHQGPPRPGPGAPRRTTAAPLQRLDRKQHFLGKSPVDRDCAVCSCQARFSFTVSQSRARSRQQAIVRID